MPQPVEERRHSKISKVGNLESAFVWFQLFPNDRLLAPIKRSYAAYLEYMERARQEPQRGIKSCSGGNLTLDPREILIERQIALGWGISETVNHGDLREGFPMGFGHELERRGSEGDDDVGSAVSILANVKIPKTLLVSGTREQYRFQILVIKLDLKRSVFQRLSNPVIDQRDYRESGAGFVQDQNSPSWFGFQPEALRKQEAGYEQSNCNHAVLAGVAFKPSA
jgi:hypothetical protein